MRGRGGLTVGVLAALPVTVEAAVPAPVKNGDLVFVAQTTSIVTQAPGPANTYSDVTGGYNPEYSPDGKNLRTFTDVGPRNLFPDWSPDSRKIAFVTDRFQGYLYPEVVTLPRSGKGTPVRVSYASNPQGRGYIGVAWSPDGRKIAALQFYNPTDPDEERTQARGYLPDGSHDFSLTGPIAGDDTSQGLDWAPKVTK